MTPPSRIGKLRPPALLGSRGLLIARTGSWSLIAKASAAMQLFFSVPFVLSALGPAQFGTWATLVSLVTFAGFLDFGIGNGAMNLVAAAHGRGADVEIATIIREARRALLQIASWLLVAIFLIGFFIPWHRVLGLPLEMAQESRSAALVVLVSIAISTPLNLANRIQLGLGRGNRAFQWQAAGQLLALGTVITFAKLHASLPLLTAAAISTPLITSAINTKQLSHQLNARSTLIMGDADRVTIRRAIRMDGLAFFGLQLSAALAFSADLPLISSLASASDAGRYAIVQRLFSVVPLSLSLVWAPLWPLYRYELTAGRHDWVARTLRRTTLMAMCIAGIAGLAIIICFNWITSTWLHRALIVAPTLLSGFAAWIILEAGGTALATFLNAAGVMRFQLICTMTFAVCCFSCKAWLATRGYIIWLPWATVATWTITNAVPFLRFRKRILADAYRRTY